MINISIKTIYHYIDISSPPDYGLYSDYDNEGLYEMIPYVYNKKDKSVDVYLFVINRVSSKVTEEKNLFFKLDTKKSLFSLLDYTEKHNLKTKELFDYWRAQRHDQIYYLELIVHSASKELLDKYINATMNWCNKYGIVTFFDNIQIPKELHSIQSKDGIDIPIEYIIKKEKRNHFSKNIPIYWDTGYPGFEGAGADSALAWASLGLSTIGIILGYYGLYKQRDNFRDRRRVKKFRNEIFNRFNIKGTLQDPDFNRIETDRDLRRIYRFTEIYNNKPYAFYIIYFENPCYFKKNKSSYSISQEFIYKNKHTKS